MTISMPLSIRQNLRNLGFSDNDITILAYLFRVHKANIKDISKHTTIAFSTCEYILTNLSRLKLILITHNHKSSYYEICTRPHFMEWIEQRKQQQIEQYNTAELEMETFLKTIQEASWKPDVIYYEGPEGMKEIYDDILDTGTDTLAWYDGELMFNYMKDYANNYIGERVKKGIKTRVIMPDSPFNQKFAKRDKRREAKLVKDLPIKGEIRIYGDKVSVIIFRRGKLVGYVQQSKVISEMFRIIFNYCWAKTTCCDDCSPSKPEVEKTDQ